MKILMVHNFYQQRGGEDVSTESEVALLRQYGHEVEFYSIHNDLVNEIGKLRSAFRAIWSIQAYRDVKRILSSDACANFSPLISPSVYYAAKACGVPVVQSIRNFRLFCLNGFFHVDGAVCERCFKKTFAWSGIKRRCYRNNMAMSSVVATMQFVHHQILRSWNRRVDCFIALFSFVKGKLVEGGIAVERVVVKPNFVIPDPGVGSHEADQFVFVGRLSPEKGINTLIHAWALLNNQDKLDGYKLIIIGDGPERSHLEEISKELPVLFHGQLSSIETSHLVGISKCLIFPSEWYETFGRVSIEAYAKGIPVIASRIGAVQEPVEEHVTGLLFEPGDIHDLATTIEYMIQHPEERSSMGVHARNVFEERYSADRNIAMLESIYRKVSTK